MSVRAKFKVQSVTKDANGHSVKLEPVTCGSVENERFFKWTPCGSIQIGTLNEEAANQFEPGKEFYVDFTQAEPAE
ncbi:hypothetical protein G8770_03575 [Aestuariicella hydrocarbonica]|uniref:Uncharacterized protein n=1 Tax=Pseudomaricurvus hydrocarbonicus TaxID=1470433 RepID=A0A9E5MLT8_9GAMM|nr:hypothetical protein [Aestuariicella hydrocarbonica]NHO64625.1 hypothetical protein [Aestuariicella hydrocarbonica]